MFPDQSQFNLPEDFIYIEKDWGSLYYKHMGKHDRITAKKLCSDEGVSVSLPMPRFAEENEFYRVYFTDESLWLNLVDDYTGVRNEDDDHYFIAKGNSHADEREKYYDWINMDLSGPNELKGVSLTYTGRWRSENLNRKMDSICVFNVIPESCSKCPNKLFCRYQDNRRRTHCLEEIQTVNVNDGILIFPPKVGMAG